MIDSPRGMIHSNQTMQQFIADPFRAVTVGQIAKCRITVDKTNLKAVTGCFSFYLHSEDDHGEKGILFLYGEKLAGLNGTKFRLYNSVVASDESAVGTVSTSLSGTDMTVYECGPGHSGSRLWCGSVHYAQNMLGIKGPKQINVLIPGMSGDHSRVVVGQDKAARKHSSNTVTLSNKQPDWNTKNQQHELDFFGRAVGRSAKNFQLVTKTNDKYIVLQLCKHDNHYKLDFSYPLCAVQAFGIALTMFVNSVNGV